eukprot:CAMPEP_0194111410 /NCGR_PEP_ID=MMETSP0150-20130528/10413_1 /TAXON_ID=122233 /ORGANISM="Chaetoceros debilis, Strain MM31A-1" /LENGTH=867 /DNA_ID=CAMNT_0038800829 /DNA_START=238 /DNA_END=2838 /DNA_ORIENTATION=+
MLNGVSVIKVAANGKTKPAFLTVSPDKFTIYITESKFKNGKVGIIPLRKPLLGGLRVTSIGSNNSEVDEMIYERALDVGGISRIQRGQSTLKFELAKKMSNRLGSSPVKRKISGGSVASGVNGSVSGNSVTTSGASSTATSSAYMALDPKRCFSIIFTGNGERTLDLMVEDDEVVCGDVVRALQSLLDEYSKAKLQVGSDILLLRYIWMDVDRDKSNSINAAEFAKILNRINFFMKKSDSDKMYHSFAKMIGLDRSDRRRGLTFEQCGIILHKIKRDSNWQIKPVRQIWFDLFGEYMNTGRTRTKVSSESFLKKFLLKKQVESHHTMEAVQGIFQRLNKLEVADVAANLHWEEDDVNAGRYIDRDRFEVYLFSKENDIFDPVKQKFDPHVMSMNRSLSEYWINSSHNTYLTGDQFKSKSSVEMYMYALYGGCRCLELDCFDGHRDGNNKPMPVVYHGLTFTSQIVFRDIIETIKLFLDSNPDCFPLILSLENHCSPPYQDVMASIMISNFEDSLYIPDESNLHDPLPSPEKLKGKVLLKGRRITDTNDDFQHGSVYDTDSDDDSEIEEEHTIVERDRDDKPLSPKATAVRQVSNSAFSPDLSRITIFHGVRVTSFQEGMKSSKDCMLSIDESRARKLCRIESMNKNGWLSYNNSHLSRVYPSGKRIDSSNFSPITAWSRGSQLVALNIQTPDYARRLNDGRFRQNGNCGYVLKPDSLRLQDHQASNPVLLSIKVLCATCLPKSKGDKKGECINPYVNVSVYDIPRNGGKENAMSHHTQHVTKNGFNPIWFHEHPFKFKIENTDVAMVQFSVWDRDVAYAISDNFIGSASIPISCIREGYRSVQLYDANNKRNGAFECATLLVEVKWK